MTNYHTQWTGQFYVAAELTKRGYLITFTLGNAPVTDLLARVPDGSSFSVEVKSRSTPSHFIIPKEPPARDDQFWIFVVLKDGPRYFIATSDEVRPAWLDHKSKLKGGSLPALNWGVVQKWEDRWDILPLENLNELEEKEEDQQAGGATGLESLISDEFI